MNSSFTAVCRRIWPLLHLQDKPLVPKTSTLLPQTHVCSTTLRTPRRRPRAILKDSLSSLVSKEGTDRAPSHAPDSEEETDNRRTFVLASDAETSRDEKWCS